MPEFDDDALRAGLRDLYESALPHVRPPGVDALHRRIQRRTAARAAALAMTACAALVTIILTLPMAIRGPQPADTPSPSTTGATSTVTSSPEPTASTSPTVSPEAEQATPCDSNPRVGVSYTEPTVRFWLYSTTGDPICADVERYFSWQSYRYLDDGRQRRYAGATWGVRPGTTYSDTVRTDPTCPGDIYFAAGAFSAAEIPPGMHHPFPIASAENNWRGTILSFLVPTYSCVETPAPTPSTSWLSSPPPF